MMHVKATIDIVEPNPNRSLYEDVESQNLPSNIREELRNLRGAARKQYLRKNYPDNIDRPWLDIDPEMWASFNPVSGVKEDHRTWLAQYPQVPMGLREFNQLLAWGMRNQCAEEAGKVSNMYTALSRQEVIEQHLAFVEGIPDHATRDTSAPNVWKELTERNAAMSQLLSAKWFNGFVTKSDLTKLEGSTSEAERKMNQHSADKRVALDEFKALLKRVPKRATMTREFAGTVKELQEKLNPLFDLAAAGWFNSVVIPKEDAEMSALINKARLIFEQHGIDTDAATVRMQRRTLWDFVLIKRLFR